MSLCRRLNQSLHSELNRYESTHYVVNRLSLHNELTHIDSTHYVVSSIHYVGDCDSTHYYVCSEMIHSLRRRLNQSQHSEFSHYIVSRTHYIVIDSISYIDSLCSDSIAYIVRSSHFIVS